MELRVKGVSIHKFLNSANKLQRASAEVSKSRFGKIHESRPPYTFQYIPHQFSCCYACVLASCRVEATQV